MTASFGYGVVRDLALVAVGRRELILPSRYEKISSSVVSRVAGGAAMASRGAVGPGGEMTTLGESSGHSRSRARAAAQWANPISSTP